MDKGVGGVRLNGCVGSWANIVVQTQVIYLNLANVEYVSTATSWE